VRRQVLWCSLLKHKYWTLDFKVRNSNSVYTPLSQVKTDTIWVQLFLPRATDIPRNVRSYLQTCVANMVYFSHKAWQCRLHTDEAWIFTFNYYRPFHRKNKIRVHSLRDSLRTYARIPPPTHTHTNCNNYKCTFLIGTTAPQWTRASSFTGFLDHSRRRNTVGRTSLDEWSARRRDLNQTAHNIHNRQTSMPLWDSNTQSQQVSGRRPTP